MARRKSQAIKPKPQPITKLREVSKFFLLHESRRKASTIDERDMFNALCLIGETLEEIRDELNRKPPL